MYPTKKLWEVCEIIRGVTYKPEQVKSKNEGLACFRTKNIQEYLDESDIVYIDKTIVKNPEKFLQSWDILVSSANSLELLWKCCLIENLNYEATLGWFITCMRANPDHIFYKYFYFFYNSQSIQTIVRSFSKKTTGIANLQLKEVENLSVPLPPLSTQKLIVDKLDMIFVEIEKSKNLLEKNLQNMDEMNKSVLEKIFANDKWEKKKLWEVCEILDNKRIPISSKEREKRTANKGILYPYYWATQQNWFIDDYIFDEELVLLWEDGVDFLNPKKTKAYLISGKTWVNNHAHVLKWLDGILNNTFLLHFLNIFDYFWIVSGTTRLKLNQSAMKNIPIPLPPLETQKNIVSYLDNIFAENQKLKNLYQAQIKNLDEMKQSFLKKAFAGELV